MVFVSNFKKYNIFFKFFLRVYDIIGYSVDEFNDVILYKYVYLEDFVMFVVCYKICKFILCGFYIWLILVYDVEIIY